MLARVNHRGSRVILALGALFGALLLAPPRAHACSCVALSFEEQRERAAAIFEGRVELDRVEGEERIVTLRVTQAWRGVEHESVEVRTATNGAACGFAFEVGQHYLVYATHEGEALHVSLCSRTARMDDAGEDRQLLGSGTIPVDVVDDPEPPAPREPPATRAGCASCSVRSGAEVRTALGLALAVLAIGHARRAFRMRR